MELIQLPSIYVSGAAFVVSVASFVFSVLSWRETHRPIVTAYTRCPFSGNVSSVVEIVVSNSGNRPAKNVWLHVPQKELEKALSAPPGDPTRSAVEKCFSEETFIPLLENGMEVTNNFGIFTAENKPDTWHYKSVLQVRVTYQGLNGRKYSNKNPLRIVCNKGFALSYFEHSK
ncbi:MAG: hypothetical protein ACRERV_00505 [Methylococcales bacterium]